MSRFRIPDSDRQILQTNEGEVFGNLQSSFGVDTRTNPGKFRGSRRMYYVSNEDTADQSAGTMEELTEGAGAFVLWADEGAGKEITWIALGDDAQDTGGFGIAFQNTRGGDPTNAFNDSGNVNGVDFLQDDMIVFDDRLWVTIQDPNAATRTEIAARTKTSNWDTDYWTDDLPSGGGEGLNQKDGSGDSLIERVDDDSNIVENNFAVLEVGEPLLLIGHDRFITTVDSYKDDDNPSTEENNATVSFERIEVRRDLSITKILTTSTRAWIGTRHRFFDKGVIYEWDLGTADANGNDIFNRAFPIDAEGALAGCVLNDIPYFMCSDGAIRAYSGSSFKRVAALPTFFKNKRLKNATNHYGKDRFVHPNGMQVIDGYIHVLINGELHDGTYDENTPSGIWVYDHDTDSFEHRYSLGIADGTDYGQHILSKVGAIAETNRNESRVLAGAQYYTGSGSATKGAIFAVDNEDNYQHRSNFVLPELHTNQVEDMWQHVYTKFRKFANADDEIVLKYRTAKDANLPQVHDITWTSTTTFTTTDSGFSNVSDGNEVDVLQGTSAGTTAHITDISESGGTYTVTIDDAIGAGSGTAKARVDNWRKLRSLSNQNEATNDGAILKNAAAHKLQVKVELRGTGDHPEIDQFIIDSSTHKNE